MLSRRDSVIAACLILVACAACGAGSSVPGGTSPPVEPQVAYFPPIPPPNEFDTTAERSDYRRLMIGNCPDRCSPGPLARIQPRVRAASWSAAHRDSGEVIARIISEGPYPKFNIQGRDTVWWAVVRRGDSVISIFRSTSRGSKDVIARTEVISHGEGFFRGLSQARWLWSDRDDMAWGTCDGGACCKSDGIARAR